jgi:Ubiquitin-conjugating enzyme
MKRSETARLTVLEAAAQELARLSSMSDLIKVEAARKVNVPGWPASQSPEGWPPDLYLVTFLCGGYVGIDSKGKPEVRNFHQMALYLDKSYPAVEPKLAWITPIWHPNIESAGAKHVCTNSAENHKTLRPLSELIQFIGEMVQYKRYHAKHEEPWPLNREVAKWVLEIAEPAGWIAQSKPVDPQPLMRGISLRVGGPAIAIEPVEPKRKILFSKSKAEVSAIALTDTPGPKIKFGNTNRAPKQGS